VTKLSFTDYELDTPSWHTDIFWRETAQLNVLRAKLNSQLNTSYCVVRRRMQSMPIFSPSQTCQTCSAMSPHVASLILLTKLDLIAEYDHHIVFVFCKRNGILSPNMITKFFCFYRFIIYVAFSFTTCLNSLFLTNFIFTDYWHNNSLFVLMCR
jgi:hypothetical protein